jgi:hypothetical protein
MHVRRALLLFAIVLALAAVAASVSNPRDDNEKSDTSEPLSVPGASAEARTVDGESAVVFNVARPRVRRVQSGRATTVRVRVPSAGQVQIRGLGQSSDADEVTPARFDLLPSRPGRYPVEFVPAAGDNPEPVGTLVAVRPKL